MVLSFSFRRLAASNVLLQKKIMNLTQIFSRLAPRFIPRQFGLLTGIFCIIGLFSALQLSSSFLLTASLNEAQRNEQRNQLARSSRAGWIRPVFLLAASDLLNRSGVYFMQDKETGSEGSWHSLMDEAQNPRRRLNRHGKHGSHLILRRTRGLLTAISCSSVPLASRRKGW